MGDARVLWGICEGLVGDARVLWGICEGLVGDARVLWGICEGLVGDARILWEMHCQHSDASCQCHDMSLSCRVTRDNTGSADIGSGDRNILEPLTFNKVGDPSHKGTCRMCLRLIFQQ